MSQFNATLKFSNEKGRRKGLGLWVMSYQQQHQLAGSSEQSHWYKHFYPKSYSPGPIQITGRARSQARYSQIAGFIREHQELMIQRGGFSNAGTIHQIPLMRLGIPTENIYVDGWVDTFEAGAKRFNVAPEFSFDFFVIKDNHSKNAEMRPASVIRSWWNASIIDAGEIHNEVTIDQQEGTIYDPYTDPNSNKSG